MQSSVSRGWHRLFHGAPYAPRPRTLLGGVVCAVAAAALLGPASLASATVPFTPAAVSGAVVASAVAATATSDAAVSSALATPTDTTEVWIDIEGSEAHDAVTEISSSSAGNWNDSPATLTPFGASAVFPATPGAHDVRIRLEATLTAPFTADIAVTYADDAGVVLGEVTLRNAIITPGDADSDGWIDWAALTEDGVGPGTADGTADAAANSAANGVAGSTANSTANGAPSSASNADATGGKTIQAPLPTTGADTAWWLAIPAAAAVGSGAIILARRARRGAGTAPQAAATTPGVEN